MSSPGIPLTGLTRALLCALCLSGGASACDAADDSFRLSAGFADLPSYFPAYLGNGYLASLSAPRGTEATRAYVIGLMDYKSGDMARPASIPGWSEVDFSPNAGGPGQVWLNRAALNERHFRDYRQTLDLRTAMLTTSYRYVDRGSETQIEVTSLVSEASAHIAATQVAITPDYDGRVELSFPLTLWSEYAPRFPLGQMSGPEMEEALAASGLSLEPRPPAESDRTAVWYPGYTAVRASDGDTGSLSMWLDGQAQQGLAMAMAAAVGLPKGVSIAGVTLQRDRYRLALNVTLQVERGKTYTFTKYAAVSRAGWGGTSAADLELVRAARERGFEQLAAAHRNAWDALWQSDIEIDGDPQAQRAVHSELYYLLASAAAGTAWAPGPCGLSLCYVAHVFWDSDTWIFPALLLLHPEQAKPMVEFRWRTLDAARQRARQHGFDGAMYPWESDPENGTEQVPHSAFVLGETELHVTADVAIAQWQYFLATQDRDWLRAHGWPVIREVARFWASRATYNPGQNRYDINHVNSVAESNTDVPNDTFTNVSAARALNIAVAAAAELGEHPDPLWQRVARGLYIPLAADGQHHLPFDPTVVHTSEDFGGGPLALLFLPSLDLEMSPKLLRGDYDYAVRPAALGRVSGGSMNMEPRSVAAAEIGDASAAAAWFAGNFTGGTLKPPFNARTETAGNNVAYFMTGSGAYIQNLVYGFTGLRTRAQGLVAAYPPVLPEQWHALTLRNVSFRGKHMDIRVARDATGAVRLSREVR
jgi:trehalose/maltose hydrolase-like predicted phosphorylase